MVFIAIPERTGLICEVGEQIFRMACAIANRLGDIDASLTVTVNVSLVQLNEELFYSCSQISFTSTASIPAGL